VKTNESNFAFICFHLLFRIRTFQRVTADSNKKIASKGVRAAGCERGVQTAAVSRLAAGWTVVLDSDNHDIISAYFCFVKVILDFLKRQPLAARRCVR
jgi:hypothetical protein